MPQQNHKNTNQCMLVCSGSSQLSESSENFSCKEKETKNAPQTLNTSKWNIFYLASCYNSSMKTWFEI